MTGTTQRGESMRRKHVVLVFAVLVAIGVTSVVAGAVSTSSTHAAPAVTPFALQAPESAFTADRSSADPIACQRPAPDNRVSTTIHCYTPNEIRAFYGLGPLTAGSTEGAGQTIVLVDSYGSPTGAEDLGFFATDLRWADADFEAGLPARDAGLQARHRQRRRPVRPDGRRRLGRRGEPRRGVGLRDRAEGPHRAPR